MFAADAYSRSRESAAARLSAADAVFSSIGDKLSAAIVAAMSAQGTAANPASRAAVADAIAGYRDSLLADFNATFNGSAIFAGTAATEAAYAQVGGAWVYQGNADSLQIEVDIPEGRHDGKRDLDANLRISVPAGASLAIESVSSSTAVGGVGGSVAVESVSGGVEIDGAPESASAETVSGAIRITGSRGRVHAESVSGSVAIDGGSGEVEAATVSGRVMVEVGAVERGRLETVSGEVTFSGALAPGGELDVEAHSGQVEIALPAATSARFRIETFSGGIDNGLSADEPRRTSQYAPGRELEFTLGSGDGEVRIESFSGEVVLRPQ